GRRVGFGHQGATGGPYLGVFLFPNARHHLRVGVPVEYGWMDNGSYSGPFGTVMVVPEVEADLRVSQAHAFYVSPFLGMGLWSSWRKSSGWDGPHFDLRLGIGCSYLLSERWELLFRPLVFDLVLREYASDGEYSFLSAVPKIYQASAGL